MYAYIQLHMQLQVVRCISAESCRHQTCEYISGMRCHRVLRMKKSGCLPGDGNALGLCVDQKLGKVFAIYFLICNCSSDN